MSVGGAWLHRRKWLPRDGLGQRLFFSRVPQDGRLKCLLTYRARAGLGHDLEDCGEGGRGPWNSIRRLQTVKALEPGSQQVTRVPQGPNIEPHPFPKSRDLSNAGGGKKKTWLDLDLSEQSQIRFMRSQEM